MVGQLHPVTLSLKVAMHRGFVKTWVDDKCRLLKWFIEPQNSPEYPQKPVAHLKSPTAIRMSGITTHCDTVPFAGSKKDTKGKAGFCCFVSASVMIKVLLRGPDTWSSFLFLRGRCDVGAIFTFG
jgi:hypothetical protein